VLRSIIVVNAEGRIHQKYSWKYCRIALFVQALRNNVFETERSERTLPRIQHTSRQTDKPTDRQTDTGDEIKHTHTELFISLMSEKKQKNIRVLDVTDENEIATLLSQTWK